MPSYAEIEPAWHWNKKYWNQVSISGSLPDGFVRSLLRHSYSEIVRKLPRRFRVDHPEIETVS